MSLHIPEAKRPSMKDYGISTKQEGLIAWEWVRAEMEKSRNYWICSTRPDNRPHAAPVWGVVLDDIIYFGSGETSRKAKNLHERPAVVVHLESGDDCVIIEGEAKLFKDIAVIERLAPLYGAKYAPYQPTAEELAKTLFCVQPKVVMAWKESDFPNSATKWVFEKS